CVPPASLVPARSPPALSPLSLPDALPILLVGLCRLCAISQVLSWRWSRSGTRRDETPRRSTRRCHQPCWMPGWLWEKPLAEGSAANGAQCGASRPGNAVRLGQRGRRRADSSTPWGRDPRAASADTADLEMVRHPSPIPSRRGKKHGSEQAQKKRPELGSWQSLPSSTPET